MPTDKCQNCQADDQKLYAHFIDHTRPLETLEWKCKTCHPNFAKTDLPTVTHRINQTTVSPLTNKEMSGMSNTQTGSSDGRATDSDSEGRRFDPGPVCQNAFQDNVDALSPDRLWEKFRETVPALDTKEGSGIEMIVKSAFRAGVLEALMAAVPYAHGVGKGILVAVIEAARRR